METLIAVLIILAPLFLCLHKFLPILCWDPIHLKKAMEAQGIKGPPYKFLHGSTKEATNMLRESMDSPMELSHDIFPKIQPHIYEWNKTYGKIFLSWHGPKAQLFVNDPELVKEILINKDGAYAKAMSREYVRKLLGDGLATTEGKKWVRLRKLANRAFHAESLKNMIPLMVASVEKMLERWSKLKEVEAYEEFRVMTSDAISRTAFGSSYSEGENVFDKMRQLINIISRNAHNVKLPEEKVEKGELDDYGFDFLASLVKGTREVDENTRISIDEVIDECKTFYLAGHDTTLALLTWTVLLLAMEPDWQDKARKEVIEIFGYNNLASDDNGFQKLKLMNMIINESLRLYPPAVLLTRAVQREVKLGKLTLTPNMELLISPLAVHHDPEIWGEDVHLFRPERFAEGVAKATNNNSSAYIPFGMGPRNCVGSSFATMEAKIALSMILQRYAFTLSPKYAHCPFQLLTTSPRHGLQIVLHKL
ncbi:Cytochrome P450 [Acorus gramineus]|uniref:Cytochrome P450 n=1 Tax=Acorus gramineus TaxID=55184 RepID=A0AAV9BCC8_ACOGR|nr:Cytochrome P450 [Acorus gramineus]